MTDFAVKAVTGDTWPDLELLFEGRGGPKYCWCMAWRELEDRTSAGSTARKKALHGRVVQGVPIGLLGYVRGKPVAWCSVAPRETFLRLSKDQDDQEAGIWSVVCFFVQRDHRKVGLSARMLDAAAQVAKASGARVLEGYPVDPDSPSYRFMGFAKLFHERGFQLLGRTGSRRYVMRLDL